MFLLPRFISRPMLRKRPFPAPWHAILDKWVPFYGRLSLAEKERLQTFTKIFVWEKIFISAGGIRMSDEIRVTIAAAAARLILGLDIARYDRLTEIVVYPGAFKHPEHTEINVGEAHDWGVVVLSWGEVRRGLADPDDGRNTVFHEFAHVLDRATGTFDGTPALHHRNDYARWAEVMSHHFRLLQAEDPLHCEVLDEYGAENEAEFFAVITEHFFETALQLQSALPDLYHELVRFYRADPAMNAATRNQESTQ